MNFLLRPTPPKRRVVVENLSETEPLVLLKHFGPGNPDAESLRKIGTERSCMRFMTRRLKTSTLLCTMRCGPAWWVRVRVAEPAIDLETMLNLTAVLKWGARGLKESIFSCSRRMWISIRAMTT